MTREKPISMGDFDFDDDGVDDIVFSFGSRNADHYLFVHAEPCPRYIGAIPAAPVFGLSCTSTRHNGFCVISAAMLMIHGEAQHQRYAFDGEHYVEHGPSKLGPRPPHP
jgi:hypothetical protein